MRGGFDKLDVVLGHHFDTAAPRVAKVQTFENFHSHGVQASTPRRPVIGRQAKMATLVRALPLTQAESQKLVIQINEHAGFTALAQGELEDLSVKIERRV